MFAKAFVASGSVQLQFYDAFTIAAINLQYKACMPLNASISEQKKKKIKHPRKVSLYVLTKLGLLRLPFFRCEI